MEAGDARVQVEDISQNRVDLVWPHAVTWDSAQRLARKANHEDSSFRFLFLFGGGGKGILAVLPSSAPAKRRRLSSKQPAAASAEREGGGCVLHTYSS